MEHQHLQDGLKISHYLSNSNSQLPVILDISGHCQHKQADGICTHLFQRVLVVLDVMVD